MHFYFYATTNAKTVLVVGHSFIRRIRSYIYDRRYTASGLYYFMFIRQFGYTRDPPDHVKGLKGVSESC